MTTLRRLAEAGLSAAAALRKQHRLDLAIEIVVVVDDLGDLEVLADVEGAGRGEAAAKQRRCHATNEKPHGREIWASAGGGCARAKSSPFCPNADGCLGFLRALSQ